jgi:DNA repair exonuclease SbcCD ATPase subunit
MSMRDIHKAVREEIDKKIVEEVEREAVSVEIQAKAIELLRSGEIKNPNDLVLKLGVSLDVAENLFERILSNEKIIASSVTKVVDKLKRLLDDAKEYSEHLEKKTSEISKLIAEIDDKIVEVIKYQSYAEKSFQKLKEKLIKLGADAEKYGVLSEIIKSIEKKYKDLKEYIDKDLKRYIESLFTKNENEIKSLIEKITNQEKIFNNMKADIERLKILMTEIDIGLGYRFNFKENTCKFMDEEGYCKGFAYLNPIQGLYMKSVIEYDRIKYYINVNRHRYVCLACPYYTPRYKVSSPQKTS